MRKAFLLLLFIYSCNGFATRRIHNPEDSELYELSIIHINDFHARFVQTSPTSSTCRKGRESECVGGLARVLTASRQLLHDRPNAIFLNAGDLYQGTLWHNVHHWNATAHFMNMLPLDAITIGNHDFDDGISGLVPLLLTSKAPFVSSNIDDSEEPSIHRLYNKSLIIERGGQNIGIIGVILKRVSTMAKTGKLKFLDEIESVNAEANKLKSKGVNIIIVLSHSGLDIDKEMAANCPDVDVIVGGHSHTFLYNGTSPSNDIPQDMYPIVVQQTGSHRNVLVVHAGAFTKYLGNLTVSFDSQGEVVGWEGNPIFLNNSIPQDPKMLEELKPWEAAAEAFGNRIIGETKTALKGDCYKGECTLGNLITDAMVHTCTEKPENPKHWTHVAIGCINAGGMRASIEAGNITYGDVVTVEPFENTWDTVELKGEDFRQALEEAVLKSYEQEYFAWGGFLVCSGLRVVYNLTNPAWSRVVDVQVRCQACEEPKYEELRADDWYRVIFNSFVLDSGECSTIKEKHRNRNFGQLDIDATVEYIQKISPIEYQLDRRIQLLGKWTG